MGFEIGEDHHCCPFSILRINTFALPRVLLVEVLINHVAFLLVKFLRVAPDPNRIPNGALLAADECRLTPIDKTFFAYRR